MVARCGSKLSFVCCVKNQNCSRSVYFWLLVCLFYIIYCWRRTKCLSQVSSVNDVLRTCVQLACEYLREGGGVVAHFSLADVYFLALAPVSTVNTDY